MLQRDVANITTYFSRFAPALAAMQYGNEIWSLYESAALNPEVKLTGRYATSTKPADVAGVMEKIIAVRAECDARQRYKALLEK